MAGALRDRLKELCSCFSCRRLFFGGRGISDTGSTLSYLKVYRLSAYGLRFLPVLSKLSMISAKENKSALAAEEKTEAPES